MGGSVAAWLIAVALCAALYSVSWRPLNAQAVSVPGYIYTNAGSVGSGPALSLGQVPYSLAIAGTHLYIGDIANPVVRDLDTTNGQEAVLAGNDGYGYKGDGGPAVSAMIQGAGAITRCGTDTYFADTLNYVIRKIDNAGNITTVVGTGRRGYFGDGVPATSATISRVFGLTCMPGSVGPDAPFLYFTDADNGVLRGLTGTGLVDTLLTGLVFPTGVLLDGSANLYVADAGTDMVWFGDGMTHMISAFAGIGVTGSTGDGGPATSATLNSPWGLAYTYAGGVYRCQCYISIGDRGNNKIRVVDSYGVITTLAGTGTPGSTGDGGPAAAAMLDHPAGLGYTPVPWPPTAGAVYVADTGNFTVRKIDMTTRIITTVAGNTTPSWSGDTGQATAAQLGNPYAVAVDGAGNEYIADNQNNVIRRITPGGVISTVAGNALAKPGFSGDGGPATSAQLNDPRGLAVTPAGDIAISDTGNQRVRWVTAAGVITTITGNGIAGFLGDNGPAAGAEINYARGVAIDAGGKVYIADTGNQRVRVVDRIANTINTFAGTGTAGYSGDAVAPNTAMLNGPRGLAFDSAGNLFISDSNNNRVRRVGSPFGLITTFAGNGTAGLAGDTNLATSAALDHPFGLAIDASGNMYIADTLNQRVRLVGTTGIISSVVATCGKATGFSGDGGPASLAQLNYPYGLAVNSVGDLFIADVDNNRVRTASGLAAGRPAICPSASAGAPTTRDTAQSPNASAPTGPRTPLFDRPERRRSSTTPTTPVLAGSVPLALAQAAAPPPAAAAPAEAAPAAAPPVAAPPAAVPPAVAPTAESAPAINSREVAMVANARNPAMSRNRNESGPAYGTAVLIPLAIISLALLGVRRR
ncbi:MAG TPA: hypothetical protein VGU71_00665, partial [Candidatus Dormibacteraeota bacterium]|nr:hypothetical protein [Candidatus Dormibacteraeota bacterium]